MSSGRTQIAVSEAKAQLTELVRRAESGEHIVLTRFGVPVVELVPVQAGVSPDRRLRAIAEARRAGRAKLGAGGIGLQDGDLYGDDGLPA